MNKRAKQHLAKAEHYLAEGDGFYRGAALEIDAALRADPDLTHREIAEELGMDRTYVTRLLAALVRARTSGEFRVDWGSGSNKRGAVLEQAKPAALVKAVQKAIKQAPAAERKKLVKALTSTSTSAGRAIANEVAERETATRRKQVAAAAEGRNDGGVPLPALWAGMVVKIDEWRRGLASIADDDLYDLAEYDGHGLERVISEVQGLHDETERWLDRLGSSRPKLRIITQK